ncbi:MULTISPECIES: carboxymuconolactone decarboxylase family protein [Micromonospora]|uniref:Alkylhydroperoxidase AhpD family core domain-containing protein n=1 Tax=Micromonospora chokoriensis TaxID=356851 RepID=A0A1C4VG17_9ACTN|nr:MULTISPECIES: carboxymuconolactone decarboxylase family protein [Micromonospora]MDG4835735.1 carboxymuconolactone decarboxylase family protein [Micromonospora sp. WMMD967]SCE82934.1 alkylhydroperoxidase AhpD family core domain-containing protein [Micromonospora chokoriensis]
MTTPAHTGQPRLDLRTAAPKAAKALYAADQAILTSPLDPTLRELIKLRVSQLNHCVHCIDLHSHDALDMGEKLDRILQLSAWRESALFTPAERAALEYAEAATKLTEHGVSDEIWAGVRDIMSDEELGALVVQVALMNAFNRFGVPLHMPAKQRD